MAHSVVHLANSDLKGALSLESMQPPLELSHRHLLYNRQLYADYLQARDKHRLEAVRHEEMDDAKRRHLIAMLCEGDLEASTRASLEFAGTLLDSSREMPSKLQFVA